MDTRDYALPTINEILKMTHTAAHLNTEIILVVTAVRYKLPLPSPLLLSVPLL